MGLSRKFEAQFRRILASGRGSFEQLEIACSLLAEVSSDEAKIVCVVVDTVVVCVPFAFSILSCKCFHSPNSKNSLSFAFCSWNGYGTYGISGKRTARGKTYVLSSEAGKHYPATTRYFCKGGGGMKREINRVLTINPAQTYCFVISLFQLKRSHFLEWFLQWTSQNLDLTNITPFFEITAKKLSYFFWTFWFLNEENRPHRSLNIF